MLGSLLAGLWGVAVPIAGQAQPVASTAPIDVEAALKSALGSCDRSGGAGEITVCAVAGHGRHYRYNPDIGLSADERRERAYHPREMYVMRQGRSGSGVCAGAVGAAGWTGCSAHQQRVIAGKDD